MTRSKVDSLMRVMGVLGLSTILTVSFAGDFPPKKYAVQLTATVQESPAKITLDWAGDPDSQGYEVSRRTPDSGWQLLGKLGSNATSYTDSNVQSGKVYEYQFIKTWSANDEIYQGYGYIRSGIKAPLVDAHGKILLVVENSLAGAISSELDQLNRDLVGDGWGVLKIGVSAGDSPVSVRSAIKNAYNSDPTNLKAVFLIGHVPVPYSGNINPDGHENHQGAWPADVYYGDVDGTWTDSSLNATTAERQENWNVPGDGKFDQDQPPATVKLQVGRVDLSNMTCYSNKSNSRSEVDLMRQYFAKDHGFRHRLFTVDRRGIICDNFSDKGKDPIAGCAWRSYPTFFGQGQVDEAPWDGYFPAATAKSYLWSFASGGGSYYWSMGVGTSDDFSTNDVKAVFTMWMGSYFGDWNNESNFLRAALGSGDTLTSTYSGFPSTWYFPMGLGETIGYCILQSQNNNTNGLFAPWDQGSHQVHISLHGDPTLRMLPVIPPSNLNASTQPGKVNLTWTASGDKNIVGYHIYRALSSDGPFTRVSGDAGVTATSYSDLPPSGTYSYMVRAIKLEQTGSGTFYNPSQGIFATATVTGSAPQPPATPGGLVATAASSSQIDVRWNDVAGEKGFKVERKTGANGTWAEVASTTTANYSNTGLTSKTDYYYRVRAFNDAGYSGYSAEAHAITPGVPVPQASVQFIGSDATTRGNWPNKYGNDGYLVLGGGEKDPLNATFNAQGQTDFLWDPSPTDSRALLTDGLSNSRVAGAWYGKPILLNLNVGATQQVAFYFVDWDAQGRAEKIEVTDAATGTSLDSRDLSGFENGAYLAYNIKGSVQITLSTKAGPNAVVSGIFFGGPVLPPISNKAITLNARRVGNQLTLRLSGDAGQKFRLESSSDFDNWTAVSNGTLSSNSIEINTPLGAQVGFKCYRAINLP